MHLFYDPTITIDCSSFSLNEEESKHAIKVMRLKIEDEVLILDGKGNQYHCKIITPNPKKCEVNILNIHSESKENLDIHIAVAPTKMNDRIEWFLEKATEIGITEITPIICKNSERKIIKEERWTKILITALKQSKRLFLPKLNPLTTISDFIQSHENGLIAFCDDNFEKSTLAKSFKATNCPIVIGPEGDFTIAEVELAKKHGYQTITLGKNRLRTETAALYSVMQAKLISEQL